VVLAALGERDEDIAASDAPPFDAARCSAARRQGVLVMLKSLATGVVVAIAMTILFGRQ
jgi:hypothetical protein